MSREILQGQSDLAAAPSTRPSSHWKAWMCAHSSAPTFCFISSTRALPLQGAEASLDAEGDAKRLERWYVLVRPLVLPCRTGGPKAEAMFA